MVEIEVFSPLGVNEPPPAPIISTGYEGGQKLPAENQNYFLNALSQVNAEMITLLTMAGISPDPDATDQVYLSLNELYVPQGTPITVATGGTGLSTVSQGDLLYGSATDVYSVLAKNTSATRYLSNTGTSNNPAWAQIDLSNGVTGALAAANGGTGFASYTQGDMLYASGTTTIVKLNKSATATRYIANTGASNNPMWDQVSLTDGVAGILPVANGGTGVSSLSGFFNVISPMTTLGDVIYGGSSGSGTRLAGNTTTTRKFLNSTGSAGLATAPIWDTVTKTDVGLSNVENTALSTWAGSTSLTTLGTITTGTWTGTTIAVLNGGTGATTASGARTNLGLIIGTDIQAYNANLATLAGLTATTDNFIISVASAWASRTPTQAKTTLSLNNVENTALSTWAGSTSITTLGTIVTGVWNGTKVSEVYGGTNQSTYTKGDILGASAANTLSKLAIGADGKILVADSNSATGFGWFSVPPSTIFTYLPNKHYKLRYDGSPTTNGANSTSTTYFYPIIVHKRSTWLGIAYSAHTFSGTAKVCLLDDSNSGAPGARVAGTSVTSGTASAGNVACTFASPVTINAGVYYMAIIFSTTSGSLNCAPTNGGLDSFWGNVALVDSDQSVAGTSSSYTYAGGFNADNPTMIYTDNAWTPICALKAQ